MSRYRKKSAVIEAFQLDERGLVGEDWFWDAVTRNDIVTRHFGKHDPQPAECVIKTGAGDEIAVAGDYIIHGVGGVIYSCSSELFEQMYEEVAQ